MIREKWYIMDSGHISRPTSRIKEKINNKRMFLTRADMF
jgi:hypothetical protein